MDALCVSIQSGTDDNGLVVPYNEFIAAWHTIAIITCNIYLLVNRMKTRTLHWNFLLDDLIKSHMKTNYYDFKE